MGSLEEAHGRVVGQTGICAEGNLYGVEVLNAGETFWGIRFPRQTEIEEGTARILLQCSKCQNSEVAVLNEVDLSVFQVTHHLTRKCSTCSGDTAWKTVQEKTDADEAHNGKKADHRKYARISMKTMACVGLPGPHADIVDVVNVSRGGVCFRSSKPYAEDTWVQVAVPYMPEAANIFVAGRIVRSRRMNNVLAEYGVEYAKSEDEGYKNPNR
jgi:hypothetical protein